MAAPVRPSWVHWILPAVFGFLGITSMPMYFLKAPAEVAVPQSALKFVEGVPHTIERDSIAGRFGKKTPVLRFSIGEFCTSYSGSNPNYREVSVAVQSGKSIRAGLAPNKTSAKNFAELYTLTSNGSQILKYADRADQQQQEHSSLLIVGLALIGISAFGSFMNMRNSQRYASIMK